MHALVVVSHPSPASLTHAVAQSVAQGAKSADPAHTVEIADLAAEGFDPRFTENDVNIHLRSEPPSDIVINEQRRVDAADALVLVYPVYWWSFPALLKGWIDRVFSNGWAYEASAERGLVKKLGHLPIHLFAIGGADLHTYARHGYLGAMRTQIDHGIFEYCGAPVVTNELLLPEGGTRRLIDRAADAGRRLFATDQAGIAVVR